MKLFGRQNSLGAQMECPEEEENNDPMVLHVNASYDSIDHLLLLLIIGNYPRLFFFF